MNAAAAGPVSSRERIHELDARTEAVRSAKEMACAEVIEGHLHLNHRIEVTDAFGDVLDTVWFRDVVRVHNG